MEPRLPRCARSLLLVGLLPVALAPAAAAQILHHAVEGVPGFRPGEQVAWVGDVDGDGLTDWATSNSSHMAGGLANAGQVRVHSGASGQLLGQVTGTLANGRLGLRLAGLGDVDGDGLPEIAATQGARVLVISTATWSPVHDLAPPTTNPFLVLAGAGDADADGRPDLAVGDLSQGRVWVHSGATGALLHTLTPPPSEDFGGFGAALAGAGDLDGDGRGELLVGAPFRNPTLHQHDGAFLVFRGADGSLLRAHVGGTANPTGMNIAELGTHLAGLGDVDGDGVRDYAAQGSGMSSAQAVLYSGSTGALLHLYPNPHVSLEEGAWGLADAGDVDGDGIPDLLVLGLVGPARPEFTLSSGAPPWELLDRMQVPFGTGPFACAPDADGDGHPDLVLGEPGYLDFVIGVGQPAQHHVGRTSVIGLRELGAEVERTCATTLNSTGEPARIWADGSVSIADDACALVAWNLPPSQPGIVFFGSTVAQTPFGNGLLCVAPPTVRLSATSSGANGVLTSVLPLGPSSPYTTYLLAGIPAFFQCWFRDPAGGGPGTDLSDAVRVSLAP